MKNNDEKRIAGCWKILYMLHIGDKEVVVGENLTEPNEAQYMCAYCEATDSFRGYGECMASDDYLEIMELYTERIAGQIKAEVVSLQTPVTTITADECHKNDRSAGRSSQSAPRCLRREYRTADHQLVLIRGNFGASANLWGSAVFVTNLYSGKESRYERPIVMAK